MKKNAITIRISNVWVLVSVLLFGLATGCSKAPKGGFTSEQYGVYTKNFPEAEILDQGRLRLVKETINLFAEKRKDRQFKTVELRDSEDVRRWEGNPEIKKYPFVYNAQLREDGSLLVEDLDPYSIKVREEGRYYSISMHDRVYLLKKDSRNNRDMLVFYQGNMLGVKDVNPSRDIGVDVETGVITHLLSDEYPGNDTGFELINKEGQLISYRGKFYKKKFALEVLQAFIDKDMGKMRRALSDEK